MSMTKPIVGVAMMKFFEEGKWRMEDLVTDHLPRSYSTVPYSAKRVLTMTQNSRD
jgi:CubicO group peptidase (beta-lactamase class C family)